LVFKSSIQIFACFINFCTAFDSINQDLPWKKLKQNCFLNFLKNDVSSCVYELYNLSCKGLQGSVHSITDKLSGTVICLPSTPHTILTSIQVLHTLARSYVLQSSRLQICMIVCCSKHIANHSPGFEGVSKYADSCPNVPEHGMAFCQRHCDLAAKQAIPCGLPKHCGVKKASEQLRYSAIISLNLDHYILQSMQLQRNL